MAIKIQGDTVIDDSKNITVNTAVFTTTGAITLPKGTEAQQPVSPATGMIRYNTDSNRVEFYDGTSWGSAFRSISGKLYFLGSN
jgi:hypothetical protein